MKYLIRYLVAAGLGGLLAGPVAQADLTTPSETLAKDRDLKIIQGRTIAFPARMTRLGITHGEVRMFLDIDANGELVDRLVVAYTHRDFADAVKAAVQTWRYEPVIVQGRAVAATADITVKFETTGVVVVERDPMDAPLAREYAFRAREVPELDRAPKALKTPSPVNPAAAGDPPLTGTTRIGFFIDEHGRVRMPVVLSADDERLGWAALVAIEQWRFARPLLNGRPVLTRATQVFTFEPAKS